MGRGIIKIRDKYLMWSTVVDAPITYGMTLEELHEWYKEEYGRDGLESLPRLLEIVERRGTSSERHTVCSLIAGNRAGPDETPLTLDEIYQKYCVEDGLY